MSTSIAQSTATSYNFSLVPNLSQFSLSVYKFLLPIYVLLPI